MTKEFDKLNYIPLPNLKESLKQCLKEEEEKSKSINFPKVRDFKI